MSLTIQNLLKAMNEERKKIKPDEGIFQSLIKSVSKSSEYFFR
jgi:hypothetical protein